MATDDETRDMFAAHAMAAFLKADQGGRQLTPRQALAMVVVTAFDIADAMMAERARRSTPKTDAINFEPAYRIADERANRLQKELDLMSRAVDGPVALSNEDLDEVERCALQDWERAGMSCELALHVRRLVARAQLDRVLVKLRSAVPAGDSLRAIVGAPGRIPDRQIEQIRSDLTKALLDAIGAAQ